MSKQEGALYAKFEKYIWKYSAIDSKSANIGMDTVRMILDSAKTELIDEIQKIKITDNTALTIGQKQLVIFIDWFEKHFGASK